jgi:ACDE family multidrug resistance protein
MPRSLSEPFANHLTPGAPAFALLGGFEAFVRGTVLSVFPLLLYRAFGDASLVSRLYFIVGLCSLCSVLLTPLMARKLGRSTVMAGGIALYLFAAAFGMIGGSATAAAVLCNAIAAAVVLVCYNAYVLDCHRQDATFAA